MRIGQQVGPFVIDKELGSGAMGAVYRARHVKSGKIVAIKVMAPGLGTSGSRAAERFEREAEILKQLDHPNIVRFYGISTFEGVRYFAMEYIQGESLDKVMSRRGRMSWEEVVELGQQLCLALQHAHEKGIIHRDLKPSNLMVLPDGTLKLTDFGIAKDTDVTQLTSANCTVGTAAYMSPEQCKGERILGHRSDLYSLGVLLYELITGRKPFTADNTMEMFLLHVQGEFPRPGKLVLELPVWLDTLICQLLEKKPEHRPLDAAMVCNVLGSVKEKVEAQRSAGVDAAQRRMIDRPPGAPKPDEEDKEAARFLLKGKVRARKKTKPFYEKAWFQATGILALLGGVALTLYLVFRPPSADRLYADAERLMKSGDSDKKDEARDGPIREYLSRYEAKLSRDPKTRQVRQWADDIDTARCQHKVDRHLHVRGGKLPYHPADDTEKLAFKAADDEEDGEPAAARQKWQELKQDPNRGWQLVADRHLKQLDAAETQEQELAALLRLIHDKGKERQPEGGDLARQAFAALRQEKFGDLEGAEKGYKALAKQTKEAPDQRAWFLLAVRRLKDMGVNRPKREDVVKEQVEKAKQLRTEDKLPQARAICLDVQALYGGEKEDPVKGYVAEARKLAEEIRKVFD